MKHAVKIGNRMPRGGRVNPGRKHLTGPDVTGRMQRQYEHVLSSLRSHHRYRTDRDRKRVAAATVRKLAEQNPGLLEGLERGLGLDEQSRAEKVSADFHGRPVRETFDVTETELFDADVPILGYLEELGILDPDDDDYIVPIRFAHGADNEDTVFLCSNPAATNLEFVGGDQDIAWDEVDGAITEGKYLVYVGEVQTIAYWTDKHHLTGPKSQKYGTPYEHEFGEDGGELPHLVFDRRNTKLLLAGGSYTITPEGIAG